TGSSIGDIGTYFPKLRDWAQQNNPVPTPINTIPGIHIVPIDQHTVAYSFKRTSDMYETNGVAIENHNTAQIFFANAEITSPDKEIARTVLNYYLYTLKQIRKAN
ncbi:MAG TPA: DUF4850 domain-containing protein, partial [Desulfobacteria bacterium]|nr:DUF4850 domain-containing protein [Desulfobacteria bacterium]